MLNSEHTALGTELTLCPAVSKVTKQCHYTMKSQPSPRTECDYRRDLRDYHDKAELLIGPNIMSDLTDFCLRKHVTNGGF